MRILISTICLLITCQTFAQIGLNFRYGDMNPQLWEDQYGNAGVFQSNYDFGLDYWFRLKEYRVEFTPEIYFSKSASNYSDHNFDKNDFGIAFNTNFYILDLVGDCDCPTFSKDGNFLSKGFFLSVAPLFELQNRKVESNENEQSLKVNQTVFGGSIGAGIDIGLTDLVTITPYVRYKFLPNSKWNGLEDYFASQETDQATLVSHLQFGIRLGFRPDYVRGQNKYRFRR